MKKIFFALAAIIMTAVFTSCVQNDPYVEQKGSELNGTLFLNEVNGTGGADQLDANKYVELYNNSNADISLNNFVLDYGGKETWRGRAEDIVPANGYKLIMGSKTTYPGMSQGLSSRNANVNLSLLDAAGNIVDYYEKVEDLNGQPLESMDHMRIPDGGTWYFVNISAQSPGTANLTDPNNSAVQGKMASMEKKLQIESVTVTPTSPTPDNDVVFLAQVSGVNVITSVVLKWMLNGTAQTDINMTKNADGLYSATIPKQADGTVADWTITATDSKGQTVTQSGTITWKAATGDYTKLKINEVNGVGKWFEIYNSGDVDINLAGVTAYYNNKDPEAYNLTWTGDASMVVPAKGYFTTPTDDSGNSLGTGLSANNGNVKLQLRAPDGTALDTYVKLIDINTGYDAIKNKSHVRIPDGTGDWYYTDNSDGTPGATNGTSTTGYTKFGDENATVVVDYTKLKINEVNGVGKWFEIYNSGDIEINLDGVTAYYNNKDPEAYNLTWTGDASMIVSAKGYFTTPTNDSGNSLGTGLSANNGNVKLQLRAPDGTALDTYVKLIDINSGYDAIKNKDHTRIPDGTGDWYYTDNSDGTPGATNGTSTTGYIKFGDEASAANPSSTVDYSQLVLNEIDGNGKFVELYNEGTTSLSLEGIILVKNESGTWWTGAAGVSISGGGYYVIAQSGGTAIFDEDTGASGISAKQTLHFALKDPNGNVLDTFTRGTSPWSATISDVTPNSFSRCPDGTGSFMLATPSPKAANPATGTDIPQN